ATWRLHGVDRMLREAWESGVILAGISAGMICWFEASVTDSFGRGLSPFHDGLGLLPGSACPHYDSEPNRRPTYQQLIGEGALPGGIAADDGAAVHFVGAEVVEAVSSRPNACAYRVELRHGRVLEHPLETRYLDASPP
ncbi:MAG: Type 1 glutamine amidotransferase-like domain-containing protein, partial [Armatimonadota bacterium]